MTVHDMLNMICEQDKVCIAFADGIIGKCTDLIAVLKDEVLGYQVDYISNNACGCKIYIYIK